MLSRQLFLHSGVAAFLAVSSVFVSAAHATPINVINGNFEQTTTDASSEFGNRYPSQQVTGWTTNGYNFVFKSGTADTTGASSEYGNLKLWGPGTGSNNGLTVSSPAGGNYLGMDGAYAQDAVSQTLHGLTPGAITTVTFYFAGAQQAGYTGLNTEQLKVSLGNESQFTPVLNNTSEGFTGWNQYSFSFNTTSSSEVLSFLAIGTPSGVPPFSLLDGVSVSDNTSPVPEPSSLALLATGLTSVGGFARNQWKRRKSA
jgi:hypothetical protein